jgi:hypothetical protein
MQMTVDCLNVTGIISQGPDMEGQAIMRDSQGVLHAAGSHLTGWASNPAQFVTTNSSGLNGSVWTGARACVCVCFKASHKSNVCVCVCVCVWVCVWVCVCCA